MWLAIARALVTAHGGIIGVEESTNGPGAVFFFRIPVERQADVATL